MTEQTAIVPGVNALVDTKDFKFRFKKDKLENKRPDVELKIAVPSTEGLIDIITKGGKGLELVFDSMYDTMRAAIGNYVGDNLEVNQANFPHDKYTWDAIANQPREDRRVAYSEEDFKAFSDDYMAIMPALTNKSTEAIGLALQVYQKKFSIVKTNKPVLKKLQAQLALYVEHTKKGEDFSEILDVLTKKLETYLASDDVEQLIANL